MHHRHTNPLTHQPTHTMHIHTNHHQQTLNIHSPTIKKKKLCFISQTVFYGKKFKLYVTDSNTPSQLHDTIYAEKELRTAPFRGEVKAA